LEGLGLASDVWKRAIKSFESEENRGRLGGSVETAMRVRRTKEF